MGPELSGLNEEGKLFVPRQPRGKNEKP